MKFLTFSFKHQARSLKMGGEFFGMEMFSLITNELEVLLSQKFAIWPPTKIRLKRVTDCDRCNSGAIDQTNETETWDEF